jgi:hypothetical protein
VLKKKSSNKDKEDRPVLNEDRQDRLDQNIVLPIEGLDTVSGYDEDDRNTSKIMHIIEEDFHQIPLVS